jgi:hypothetical protein
VALRLVQLLSTNGERQVAAVQDDGSARLVAGFASTRALAREAIAQDRALADIVGRSLGESIDLAAADADNRLLAPIDHDDPAHLHMTGTGLTHLGSAEGRDKMHKAAAAGAMTDSMRMFMMGVESGKPGTGTIGCQPEWFYKGNGCGLVGPGADLRSPDFALDAGEEPEIAGIYIIDNEGHPRRLGFALANEFSDHVTERGNYLWLAHSKLRPAAIGPELLTGELPSEVVGTSRIVRNGETVWEKPFLSGEQNMSHSIANLEHHHFKYEVCRTPGDIHVHFFGTATLSFADGFQAQENDVFEIEAKPFLLPLRNRLGHAEPASFQVRPL